MKCRDGSEFDIDCIAEGLYRVYSKNGEFLMLGEAVLRNGRLRMKTVQSFFEVN
jgi:hypothetical protein